MKFRLILPLAAAFMAAAAVPALAITVAGGIDPVSGMAALTPYVLRLAGAAICMICGVGVPVAMEPKVHLSRTISASC